MIKLKEALSMLRQQGRPGEYRVVRLVFCTCDLTRGTGGERITLLGARLKGNPQKESLPASDVEKSYRRSVSYLNLYDEHTQRYYRVHLDLIESINELPIL